MEVSVVILAAGKGTRMKSSLSKVLHKINGKEMIYFILREAKKISDDVTIVLYHQADEVKKAAEKYFENINFVLQDHQNFPGTGGAMMGVEPKYKKVLVLNGDMPLVEAEELEKFLFFEEKIVMSVFELEDPNGYGRVLIENGEVKKIIEQKDATPQETQIKSVNAGVYLFDKDLLESQLPKLSNKNAQKEYYLTDIVTNCACDGVKIKALFVEENNFKGVNSKLDLCNAQDIMQDRIKSKMMENGAIMSLPKTIFIEDGVVLEGECVIENGVVLRGATIIKNSQIKAHSIIEDSIIENSDIGPLAHIRPSSHIKDSHIGNFVEVKKSNLNGIKAGHLSYLGDCRVGEGSNIGAGTITCNYDGKNKYQTIIGKNVFIGSDTQIVAPVEIEDDCIVAAGTTVTENVKKGSLAISRQKLKLVENFFYKFFGKSLK